jgi:hypothetical protein
MNNNKKNIMNNTKTILAISLVVVVLIAASFMDKNLCGEDQHMMSNGMCMNNDNPIMEMNEQK